MALSTTTPPPTNLSTPSTHLSTATSPSTCLPVQPNSLCFPVLQSVPISKNSQESASLHAIEIEVAGHVQGDAPNPPLSSSDRRLGPMTASFTPLSALSPVTPRPDQLLEESSAVDGKRLCKSRRMSLPSSNTPRRILPLVLPNQTQTQRTLTSLFFCILIYDI
jgi:hypothetical protein